MSDPEEIARRERYRNRLDYQRWLDDQVIPASNAYVETVRTNFEPIVQFITEGPDVGEIDGFPESEAGRVN